MTPRCEQVPILRNDGTHFIPPFNLSIFHLSFFYQLVSRRIINRGVLAHSYSLEVTMKLIVFDIFVRLFLLCFMFTSCTGGCIYLKVKHDWENGASIPLPCGSKNIHDQVGECP